ncbi:PASTA domain-containing protein [Streptomyces fagopyri]|uniref:hypothetical protein n=1 Tax=Streptomyces fagopyri TaxID=2662397 RepID=UPI00382C3E61
MSVCSIVAAQDSNGLLGASADAKTGEQGRASGQSAAATASSYAPRTTKAADYTGRPLDEAEMDVRSAGHTAVNHDAADESRTIILRSSWIVCFQHADADAKTIDFAAVRNSEPCTGKDGEPIPWPTMPDVVGATYNTAIKDLKQAGIDLDRVTLDDASRPRSHARKATSAAHFERTVMVVR